MSNEQFLDRIPDQSLIEGDPGDMDGWEGVRLNRLQSTRGAKGDYAMIYSANGRNIRIKIDRLLGPWMNAFWFNPRNGKWPVEDSESTAPKAFMANVPSGPAAPIQEFDPPATLTWVMTVCWY